MTLTMIPDRTRTEYFQTNIDYANDTFKVADDSGDLFPVR